MAVKTYDPANVIVTVNGVIMSGYAEGTFISIDRDADMWSKQIGASGEGARTKSNDRSGKITLTLMKTSDSNQVLSALALIDEQSNGGAVPVVVEEVGTKNVYVCETAWIKKMPTSDFAKGEAGSREWVFETDVITLNVGGN